MMVEDYLSRRTRHLLLDARAAVAAAPAVAAVMAETLGRDKGWVEEQVKAFTSLAKNYILPD
jgi:glycerol-3-phosphate dehydrogenase